MAAAGTPLQRVGSYTHALTPKFHNVWKEARKKMIETFLPRLALAAQPWASDVLRSPNPVRFYAVLSSPGWLIQNLAL